MSLGVYSYLKFFFKAKTKYGIHSPFVYDFIESVLEDNRTFYSYIPIEYFRNHKDCVLIFVRDPNLRSVSETLRGYKGKKFYKNGQDKLIRNYGIGAQIIKALNIRKMILVTRSKKKVIGLEGYGIKITKQEIIK